MTFTKSLYFKAAALLTTLLSAVPFVCANTTSCGMIHQPKAPAQLKSFSKIDP